MNYFNTFFILCFFCLLSISPSINAQVTWTVGEAHTPDGNTNTMPSVATDNAGNFYAVWRHDAGTTGRYDIASWNGSSWTIIHSIVPGDVPFTGISDDTSLEIDANNHFHLAIRGYIGSSVTSERGVWYGYKPKWNRLDFYQN